MLLGDFNARTGEKVEEFICIEEDVTIRDQMGITDEGESATPKTIHRNNSDASINTFGRRLMSILNQSHLYIVNGRTIGDLRGKTTCVTYNGTSTVDYCIASASLYKEIIRFAILDQKWFSDHNPILCVLKVKVTNTLDDSKCNEALKPIYKFIWREEYKKVYVSNINKNDVRRKLESYTTEPYKNPNDALNDLVEIIFSVGRESIPLKKMGMNQNREEHIESQEPISRADMKNLREQKRVFSRERRLFRYDTNNNQRRIEFIRARRVYKKVKYYILSKGQEEKIYKLQELESKDSKIFWKSIKKL